MDSFDKLLYSIFLECEDDSSICLKPEQLNTLLSTFGLDNNALQFLKNKKHELNNEINLVGFVSEHYFTLTNSKNIEDKLFFKLLHKEHLNLFSSDKINKVLLRYKEVERRSKYVPRVQRQSSYSLLVRFSLLLEKLQQIDYDNGLVTLSKNRIIFKSIVDNYNLICSTVNEWNARNGFSDYDPYSQMFAVGNSNINAILRILEVIGNLCKEEELYDKYKPILIIVYKSFVYQIQQYVRSISFIIACQLLIDSPFITSQESDFLLNLYKSLFPILKEARTTNIIINFFQLNKSIPVEKRGAKDNTTRLQLFFEHNNGDKYSVRLDLPHKGISYFHLNLESLGGMKYFPLSQKEYDVIVSMEPEFSNWFIEYGSKVYYLRENKRREKDKLDHNIPAERKLFEILDSHHQYVIQSEIYDYQLEKLLENLNKFMMALSNGMPTEKLVVWRQFSFSEIEEGIDMLLVGKMMNSKKTLEKYHMQLLSGMLHVLNSLTINGRLDSKTRDDFANELIKESTNTIIINNGEDYFEDGILSDMLEILTDEILKLET